MLFWQCRIWLATARGRMHDDPIVYAAKDPTSWFIGGWSSPSPPSPICRSRGNVSNKPTAQSDRLRPERLEAAAIDDAPGRIRCGHHGRGLRHGHGRGRHLVRPGRGLASHAITNPVALGGLLGLSLVNYLLRAWRWYLYSQHLEHPGVAPADRALLLRRLRHDHDAGQAGGALRLWFWSAATAGRYERTAPLLIGDRMGDAVAIILLCLAGISAFGAAYATGTLVAAAVLVGLPMLLRPHVPLRIVLVVYEWSGAGPGCSAPRAASSARLPAARSQDLRADLGHGRHRLAVRGFAALVADRPGR